MEDEKLIKIALIISIVSMLLVIGLGIEMNHKINELEDRIEIIETMNNETFDENHWSEMEKSTNIADLHNNISDKDLNNMDSYNLL